MRALKGEFAPVKGEYESKGKSAPEKVSTRVEVSARPKR